jgi:hypothetical protein
MDDKGDYASAAGKKKAVNIGILSQLAICKRSS